MTNHDFITISKQAKDITNQRFGRLLAIGPVKRDKRGNIHWLCICDCGNSLLVNSRSLLSERSKSCGCWQRDLVSSINISHGLYKHPLYFTWRDILKRCFNSSSNKYSYYGGRGISVFPLWKDSFKEFINYVSSLPNYELKGYTLDRVNNDSNYEPGNLRWATKKQQARNRTDNYLITFQGQTKCVSEWSEDFHISQDTIRYRLSRGWSVYQALTTPVRKTKS